MHLSVGSVAGLIHSGRRGRRTLLVLRGYFDESGPGDGWFTVGGWVAPEWRWDRIDGIWNRLLGHRVFHLTDFENRRGQFEAWPSDRSRVPLITKLADGLVGNGVAGISMSVDFKVFWDRFCPDATQHQAVRLAYGFMLTLCLGRLVRSLPVPADGVAVVCEEIQGASGFAVECFHSLKNTDPRFKGKLQGIAFVPKERFRGLQAADILAHESQKKISRELRVPPDPRPTRKLMDRLIRSNRLWVGYFDEDNIERQRAKYQQLPSWPPRNS